ncbi:MAG: hypothetical protein OEY52_04365 [Gammaproteobacteria bacterium]|nr:hypothetical protein [Gammaproteobacteria bacterium]
MNYLFKILLINLGVASVYFAYLCILDTIFVLIMKEQISFLNKLPLLIVTMPFVATYFSYLQLVDVEQIKYKIAGLIFLFLIMAAVAFLELLWVSTHFHHMLGGKI